MTRMLDWVHETYRKLYTRTDARWTRLPAVVRGIANELLKVADEEGCIYLADDETPEACVFRVLQAHRRERAAIGRAVRRLLEEHPVDRPWLLLEPENARLVIRNFKVAQAQARARRTEAEAMADGVPPPLTEEEKRQQQKREAGRLGGRRSAEARGNRPPSKHPRSTLEAPVEADLEAGASKQTSKQVEATRARGLPSVPSSPLETLSPTPSIAGASTGNPSAEAETGNLTDSASSPDVESGVHRIAASVPPPLAHLPEHAPPEPVEAPVEAGLEAGASKHPRSTLEAPVEADTGGASGKARANAQIVSPPRTSSTSAPSVVDASSTPSRTPRGRSADPSADAPSPPPPPELSPHARAVREELETGRDLYPAPAVSDLELDRVALRIARVVEAEDRGRDEGALRAREALAYARSWKPRHTEATPAVVIGQVEQKVTLILRDLRVQAKLPPPDRPRVRPLATTSPPPPTPIRKAVVY